MPRVVIILILLVVLVNVVATNYGDSSKLSREGVKAQIEDIENFITKNSAKAHPSQLQSHWLQLGMLYQVFDARFHDGGSYKQPALEAFDTALETDMDVSVKSHALYRKGLLLRMMSRAEESVQVLEQSLALADSLERKVETLTAIGDSYNFIGNTDEAIHFLNQSIHYDPSNFEGFYNLVNIMKERRGTLPSEWEGLYSDINLQLKKFLKRKQDQTSGMLVSAYWSLFIVAEKLQKYDAAWNHLALAHSHLLSARDASATSLPLIEQRSAQIQQVFTRSFFPEGVGSRSRTPVFIVGMMRSGSTLVETILDAHPSIYGIGEDSIFNSNLNSIRDAIVAAHTKMQENHDPDVLAKTIAHEARRVLKLTASKVREVRDGVQQKGKIKRVVDKMLFNYRNIGFIHLIFPRATIIHTVRDPMDTLLSCFTHKFDDFGLEWAFDAAALVKQFEEYLTIIAHFKSVIAEDRIVDVNFESLVKEPEVHVRDLIVDKMGLEWDSSVLQFHTLNRSIHTHSINQVRKGIYSSGIGKWRKFAKQLEPIRQLLLPVMQRMKRKNQLPFPDEINWLLDPEYPYEEVLKGDRGSGSEKSAGSHAETNPHSKKTSIEVGPRRAHSVSEKGKIEKEWRALHGGSVKDSLERKGQYKRRKRGKVGKVKIRQPVEEDIEWTQLAEGRWEGVARGASKRSRGKVRGKVRARRKKTDIPDATEQPPPLEKQGVENNDEAERDAQYVLLQRMLEELRTALPPEHAISKALPAVMQALQFPSGDSVLDSLTAYGVCLFNTGSLKQAIEVLGPLVLHRQDLYSALIALASAYALDGDMHRAFANIDLVTQNMNEDEWTADICERRAQIANGMEKWDAAMFSLNCAIRLNPAKMSSYQMRGSIYVKQRYFRRAHADLTTALSGSKQEEPNSQSYVIFILLAKCENQFGNVPRGIKYLQKGIATTSDLSSSQLCDLYMELVINYLTISDVDNVEKYLNKIFEIDSAHPMAHGYKGLFYQNRGQAVESIAAYEKVLSITPDEKQSFHFIGLGHFARGHYSAAIDWFDRLLALDPEHYCWCLREMAWYRWKRLDTPLQQYNPDTDLHWLLKDAWIRRSPKSDYCKANKCHKNLVLVTEAEVRSMVRSGNSVTESMEDFYSAEEIARFLRLRDMTSSVAAWIQVDSPGFLVHRRQHRMFGLVVLQMAEQMREHFRLLSQDRNGGLLVPDTAVSRKHLEGRDYFDNYLEPRMPGGESFQGQHFLGWRDVFDLAVKWRQLAEPHDVVLWIDCTQAQEDGNEKVGLQTFLYHNGKNTRYYPYFKQTFALLRDIFPSGYYLEDGSDLIVPTALETEHVRNSSSLAEVLRVSGSFFCMTRIPSLARPGEFMSGTRIAVSRADPEGEALFISTPTDRERYISYSQEFTFLFGKLESFAMSSINSEESCDIDTQISCTAASHRRNIDAGVEICLEIFYYWVNFAPLSRGSAATGYSVLVGCILSLGEAPAAPLPRGVQADWLGMLSPSPEQFVAAAYPLVARRTPLEELPGPCWSGGAGCEAREAFRSARDVVYALNLEEEE